MKIWLQWSKNVYIDKLDNIVNKYNNTYHSTNITIHSIAQLKWNQLIWNQIHILTLVKMLMKTILNLKLVILLKYQNIKIFSQTVYTPNWSEKIIIYQKVLSRIIMPSSMEKTSIT